MTLPRWEERPPEVAHLLNPSFCGEVLRRAVWGYHQEAGGVFPFPLAYLVLPLALHAPTRKLISGGTKYLHNWIEQHSFLLVDFGARARSLVPFTNEALAYMLHTGEISLTPEGALSATPPLDIPASPQLTDDARECLTKGQAIGRVLSRAQSPEAAFVSLGVRP
jgi:hypothetical protein